MPKKYEKIKKSLKARGASDQKAKKIAAATYNKQRPKGAAPVTQNYDRTRKSPKRK